MSKVHQLNLEIYTAANLPVSSLPSNYQLWKHARQQVQQMTHGMLDLIACPYRGDKVRHPIYHHKCCNTFYSSLEEIRSKGTDNCPFCTMPNSLAPFGSVHTIQKFVTTESLTNAYFYTTNALGDSDDIYSLYCLRHHMPYRTTFRTWWNSKGKTNGCPVCQQQQKATS